MTVPPNPQSVVNIMESKVVGASGDFSAKMAKWWTSNWKGILSELVSTFLLMLLGCMTAIPLDGLPYQSPLYTPLGFGFVVMVNIQIFGHLSGAYMNPSVSLAAWLFGKISIATAVAYVAAQCVGSILGFGILLNMSPMDMVAGGVCVTQVHRGLSVWQALGVEVALTSTLNFLNCGVWDPVNKDKQDSVAVKFGLAIAGLSLAGGPLTGASMNPARSLGPALYTGIWTNFWIYCIGPIIGGVLPTVIYKYVWLQTKETKTEIRLSELENK